MSLDELARSASADLRRAVDHQVLPDQARDRLAQRLVARRFEHGLTAVAVVLVAVVGFLAVRDLDRSGAVPAGPSVIDSSAAPAADCLFTITCTKGSYRAALSVPLTFRTAGVVNVRSDSSGRLELTDTEGNVSLTVLSDPTPLGSSARRGRTAADLAAWLDLRHDVIASSPMATTLAGRPALTVDVYPKEGADYGGECSTGDGCVLLFGTSPSDAAGPATVGLSRDHVLRVYLLDVADEGTVAVIVEDGSTNSHAPAPAIAHLQRVLDSFAFGSA